MMLSFTLAPKCWNEKPGLRVNLRSFLRVSDANLDAIFA
jgi:hypothetical protein